ncbi:MAG: NAD(P)H-binding protein [Roseinatronobacter sp.]
MPDAPVSVLLLGATGTIGQAVLTELLATGHDVTCLLRKGSKSDYSSAIRKVEIDFTDQECIHQVFASVRADAVISCMTSRSGVPSDAWNVDYLAHSRALKAAHAAGIGKFVLLSAICVQKPFLEFQRAKLAFEAELRQSDLCWSIIRPTAFFKSLSGQVKRVQAGKPFLVFGDGMLTACSPISDRDLARYIVQCLTQKERWGKILPIGGPGPALTPRAQGEMLFQILNKPARFRHIPVAMMDAIVSTLSVLGRISPALAKKAELARIGRYYATESMLVWDETTGRYDEYATPAFGTDTLYAHYAALVRGETEVDLGAHSVF